MKDVGGAVQDAEVGSEVVDNDNPDSAAFISRGCLVCCEHPKPHKNGVGTL